MQNFCKATKQIENLGSVLFAAVTVAGALLLFLPRLVSSSGPKNYALGGEDHQDIMDSLYDNPFVHSTLFATAVAVTLASDGLLDVLYGSKFMVSIRQPRSLLLLALGVPNFVLYCKYLAGDLCLGGFTAWTDAKELCMQSALLYFHFGMSSSKVVRGIIWAVLLCNVVSFNILAWDNYSALGQGPKMLAFVLLGVSFLSVVALTIHRVIGLFAHWQYEEKTNTSKNILNVTYTFGLAAFIICKYAIFVISTQQHFTIGLRYACYTIIDIIIVLVLSTMHARLSKIESLTSENLLMVKRNFVRYISHEIRTPLNTVSMGIELVQKTLSTKINDAAQNIQDEAITLLEEVALSCNIAIGILNSILTYDKLESGDLQLSKKKVFADSIITSSCRPFSVQANNLNITYSFEGENLSSELRTALISVDVSKMSQVFRNLISNALKFTPPGGSVVVTSRIISEASLDLSIQPGSNTSVLVVSVKDSGVGISAENQKHLFKEIIQFDAADLQNGNGSGLGLWLSNSITNLHGGTLSVESTGVPGEGSTFTVRLPVLQMVSESDQQSPRCIDLELGNGFSGASNSRDMGMLLIASPESPNRELGSRIAPSENILESLFPLPRCLIVDDAPMNRKLLSRLVKHLFKEHVLAENGLEGVEYIEKALADNIEVSAIFMDSIMPVMPGIEAANKIRKLGYRGLLIGVTGNVLKEQIDDFTNNGADYVLPKPVNMKQLTETLADYFETPGGRATLEGEVRV